MSGEDRVRAMAGRLRRTAARMGLPEPELAALERVYHAAVEARLALLDPDHPDTLHPARSALILMDDVGVSAAAELAAAVAIESHRPELALDGAAAAEVLAAVPGAAELAAAVPLPPPAVCAPPGSAPPELPAAATLAALRQALRAAPAAVRRVALAERLDHARHLHLADAAEWRAFHATATAAYLPAAEAAVAARSGADAAPGSAVLHRRWRWWCDAFARRYLSRLPAAGADGAR
jgi:hypothetical protein